MDILNLARRDAAQLIGSAGFETPITFNRIGAEDVVITGLATKHHLGYNEEGIRANVKNAQITVNESDLVDAGIVTRNGSNEVYLYRQIISYPDSTGNSRDYVITETFPNETLGHIVCILGNFQR